jgi:hypothetical protein
MASNSRRALSHSLERIFGAYSGRDFLTKDRWSLATSRPVLGTASYWALMHSSGDLLSRSNRSQSGVHADKPPQHLRQRILASVVQRCFVVLQSCDPAASIFPSHFCTSFVDTRCTVTSVEEDYQPPWYVQKRWLGSVLVLARILQHQGLSLCRSASTLSSSLPHLARCQRGA